MYVVLLKSKPSEEYHCSARTISTEAKDFLVRFFRSLGMKTVVIETDVA